MLVKGLLPELVRDLDAERDDAGRAGSGKVDRWCEFHDQIFVAHFEAVLIQAKSLLDSLVQFYSIAFCRHIKSFSASKGNKGTDCGKNVISDLKSFSAADGTFSRAVTAAIRAHKTRWIDDTLLYRNEVVHFGQLRESYGHMLKLTPSPKHDPSDVAPPTLPNGQQTDAFITVIVHGAMEFSTEMMKAIFGKLQQTKPALLAEAAKKSRGK